MTSSKSYDYKKNTISRLFAIQALFQMEANGKSYRTIKNELKETIYMGQIKGSEILINIAANRVLKTAYLNLNQEKINMVTNNNSASGKFTLTKEGHFEFH